MDRLWRLVEVGCEDDCWPWRGYRNTAGYGIVSSAWMNGRSNRERAHRVAYEMLTGAEVPDDVVLHHSCGRPECCNPAHLVPMSQSEHAALHSPPREDRCIHGHAFTLANTYVYASGARMCRRCQCYHQKGRRWMVGSDAPYA